MHTNLQYFTAAKFVQYKLQKIKKKASLLSNNLTPKLCQQNLTKLKKCVLLRHRIYITHLYVIQTLAAIASKKHLMDDRENTLILGRFENKYTNTIAFYGIPSIQHVVRRDDHRCTIAHIVRVLFVQNMTNLLFLEGIYGKNVRLNERAHVNG